ncbi:MAG: hypothetical protein ABIO44_13850 [Saprospiraceae bacterium]
MKIQIQILVTYFLIYFLLFHGNSYGQKNREFIILGGPSITNVQGIVKGQMQNYYNPDGPFYSIRYHIGLGMENQLFKCPTLKLRYGIWYERRASSHTSFNHRVSESCDFLDLPVTIFYKPIEKRRVYFEFGAAFNYLIDGRGVNAIPLKSYEINSIIGFEFPLIKNFKCGIRWVEAIKYLNRGIVIINPGPNEEIKKDKTHSFQLSFIYKFKL